MFFGRLGRRSPIRSGELPPLLERRKIVWDRVEGRPGVRRAEVDGAVYELRFNDFPRESLCTLTRDGEMLAEIDELSTRWRFPR